MNRGSVFIMITLAIVSCMTTFPTGTPQTPPTTVPVQTEPQNAGMANPASVYCEEQGNKLEIRTAADRSQSGVCIFPDGSECDEWAYFRGECGPASQNETASPQTEMPTAIPIDPLGYQGWWTYTHPTFNFSIKLPEDWVVDGTTTSDPLMNGHMIMMHPRLQGEGVEGLQIRMAFRYVNEEVPLWPTGVGVGGFIHQGTLDVAGGPARRTLFVCPTGQVNSIWYQGAEESQPNILRGNMAFGFIFSLTGAYCEEGYSLSGKTQWLGEMIIASLQAP